MLLFQSVTVIVVIDCWLETEGDAGGKRGKLLCCKGFFDQIKGNLAKIQPKNHQNVHFFRTFINFHLSFVLPSIERDMDIACYLLQ